MSPIIGLAFSLITVRVGLNIGKDVPSTFIAARPASSPRLRQSSTRSIHDSPGVVPPLSTPLAVLDRGVVRETSRDLDLDLEKGVQSVETISPSDKLDHEDLQGSPQFRSDNSEDIRAGSRMLAAIEEVARASRAHANS